MRFDNLFPKDINEFILKEAEFNKDKFIDARVGDGVGIINKDIRTNKVFFYDEVYKNRREQSILLKTLDSLFGDSDFKMFLESSKYPLDQFKYTNEHETQLSRYGNNNNYGWHIDSNPYLASPIRKITFVYYFNKEPKKHTGGELQITDSPHYKCKPIDETEILTIEPKNNMGIVFPSNLSHRVLQTKSPDEFIEGRFSINCWIGNSI